MTMRFKYRLQPRRTPSIPLGGRWVQPRPIISLTLIHGQRTWLGEGLVDDGADDTVFHDSVAATLGIDLTHLPGSVCEAVGGAAIPVRFATVTIRILANQERREWQGCVAFTPIRLRNSLLGFGGFLQFFTAAFHGDLEFLDLTINSLYPGT